MSENSVITALIAAVEAKPDDIDLRLHLIEQLRANDRPAEALKHCAVIIAEDPIHVVALSAAAGAAKEAGDDSKALAYTRMAKALGADEDEDAPSLPTPIGGPPDLRVVGGKDPLPDDPELEEPTITLDDVAGLADVKERLELAFLGPIRNPELAKSYGKRMRGGLMLYGPPGCGKTYIARALAGELNAQFMSVAINDVMDMWLGESEKRLHAVFESARETAPTVLFFDELDAIGRKRSDLGTSASRDVVNQLLSELDGVSTGEAPVFVLGATNLPWDVDTALKRPGRFDRSIFVTPPDEVARKRILELNLADRPTENIPVDKVVGATKGFSGADVAHVCDSATEFALARAMKSGSMSPVTEDDVRAALNEVQPSVGRWFQTAKNYALFGNTSGEFNDLVDYIKKNKI
ncbi:MAG: AAA family ATPase [Pseudomonadota bacterium]